ncbi:hypothetical protein C8R48DRAFT_669222 [Suillus tomentosus]|nr:hypothetical protein C8R48DRAFT_669222 [Suillus tomentosus]
MAPKEKRYPNIANMNMVREDIMVAFFGDNAIQNWAEVRLGPRWLITIGTYKYRTTMKAYHCDECNLKNASTLQLLQENKKDLPRTHRRSMHCMLKAVHVCVHPSAEMNAKEHAIADAKVTESEYYDSPDDNASDAESKLSGSSDDDASGMKSESSGSSNNIICLFKTGPAWGSLAGTKFGCDTAGRGLS